MDTIREREFSKKLEKSFRIANVLADAIADFTKENPDNFTMADVLAALAATTANTVVQCESKEAALRAVETHDEIIRNLIAETPDALFGSVGNDDSCD